MRPQDVLSQAAALAAQIDPHKTAPNPRVGCLIVRDNKIISQGVHENFGAPHAEAMALKKLSEIPDAEVFITLEPCDDFEGKKTPSCTNLLLKLKPKKIWVGALDPHFEGKNIKKLKAKGLNVEYLPNPDCEALNPFFKKWITQKKPYITLKIAQSLDGKITSPNKYITNKFSLEKVHEMRAQYSAILTTTETILKDNPSLDVRLKEKYLPPISNPEIIILGKRKLPEDLNIFKLKNRKIHRLKNLEDLNYFCLKNNIDSVMTECGSEINTKLLKLGIIDEIQIFTAPIFLGKKERSAFEEEINLENFELTKTQNLENDLWMQYKKT